MRFDLSKHDEDGRIITYNGRTWKCSNISRWNRRAHNAHMTSVRAWADRCCKDNPPEKFRAVVKDKKTIDRYRKLGVKWMDMTIG